MTTEQQDEQQQIAAAVSKGTVKAGRELHDSLTPEGRRERAAARAAAAPKSTAAGRARYETEHAKRLGSKTKESK